MPFTDEEKQLLSKIQAAKVGFALYIEAQGFRNISIEELELYLADPVKFTADENDVSVEQYMKWLEFEESGRQCISLTQKGRPCSVRVQPSYSPKHFIPGVSDCCRIHQTHGLTHEAKKS